MLVTRPEPDAADTAARLEALEITPVLAPLFTRRTLDTALPPAAGYSTLAISSANALRALADLQVIDRYRHLHVVAVGDHTAREAELMGFSRVESAAGSFADLVEALVAHRPEGSVLYPCASTVSGDLPRSLGPLGIAVKALPVYELVPLGALPNGILEAIADGSIAAGLFYSRRAAERFARLADGLAPQTRTRFGVLCLSEKVAEPLVAQRFVRIGLAEKPSEDAMMALALSFARD